MVLFLAAIIGNRGEGGNVRELGGEGGNVRELGGEGIPTVNLEVAFQVLIYSYESK